MLPLNWAEQGKALGFEF